MIHQKPYHDKLNQIATALDTLHDRADTLRAELARFEALGIINASPYWRKNRAGQKSILTLTHSTNSERVRNGGSRSEYVGDKEAAPEKVQAALDALERYKEHARLKRDLRSRRLLRMPGRRRAPVRPHHLGPKATVRKKTEPGHHFAAVRAG